MSKNYIGVLNDIDEQRATESMAKSDRIMKAYFLGLMATVLNRHGAAR